jgi:hypothetical protein
MQLSLNSPHFHLTNDLIGEEKERNRGKCESFECFWSKQGVDQASKVRI